MTITKKLTETYSLKGTEGLWADINLDIGEESVNVMISSDYGDYGHWWGSTGEEPKKFLIGLNEDYLSAKFGGLHSMFWEKVWVPFIEELKREVK